MKLVPKFICGMNSAYLTSGPTIKRYISEKFNPILNVKLNVIQPIVFDIFRYIIEFDSTNQSKHCCHNGFLKKSIFISCFGFLQALAVVAAVSKKHNDRYSETSTSEVEDISKKKEKV